VTLAQGENILGRGPDSVLWLDDETVSRRHARICVEEGHALLEDLASRNGTFLRGARLDGPAELRDGDELRLGELPLRFRCHRTPGSTRTAASREPEGTPEREDMGRGTPSGGRLKKR